MLIEGCPANPSRLQPELHDPECLWCMEPVLLHWECPLEVLVARFLMLYAMYVLDIVVEWRIPWGYRPLRKGAAHDLRTPAIFYVAWMEEKATSLTADIISHRRHSTTCLPPATVAKCRRLGVVAENDAKY